jgi:hypothetical protein
MVLVGAIIPAPARFIILFPMSDLLADNAEILYCFIILDPKNAFKGKDSKVWVLMEQNMIRILCRYQEERGELLIVVSEQQQAKLL